MDTSKLMIAKIPFYGEDRATRQKYISQQLESFLTHTNTDLTSLSKTILEMWESMVLKNIRTVF